MIIVSNEKLIRRNALIGRTASLLGMAILIGGLLVSFKTQDPAIYTWLWGAIIVGFILSQIGSFFGNRWGRSPRPDEILDKNLKGLGREYTMYHYRTPASHLLIGPAGVWVLLPYLQIGTVIYDCEKKRWRVKGGGFIQNYLRFFGQESLGRPDLEAASEIDSLKRSLRKLNCCEQLPEIQSVLIFTNDKVVFKTISGRHSPEEKMPNSLKRNINEDRPGIEEAAIPTLAAKHLKEFIRSQAKDRPISETTLAKLIQVLPQPK